MEKPKLVEYKRPKHINDYPTGPTTEGGKLVEKNAGWRTYKPVVNKEKCVNCLRCYLVCPDGVIFKSEGKVDIDYDFCKGCGICEYECKLDAIKMIKEDK
ncbi:MAG: 4Fe-4S dicluster domain-containing protein [Firmicutes bacterium]|nr:4Fe-4S dicluster domain-containing protein [Bacillota bacterium]